MGYTRKEKTYHHYSYRSLSWGRVEWLCWCVWYILCPLRVIIVKGKWSYRRQKDVIKDNSIGPLMSCKLESERIRGLMASISSIKTRLWPLSTWLAAAEFLHSTHCITGCTVLFKQQTQTREDLDSRGLLMLVNCHDSGINHFTWTSQPPICPVQVQTRWRGPKISKCEEEELQRLVPSRDGLCEEQVAC